MIRRSSSAATDYSSSATARRLERPNLADELAATLREMIFDGRLAAGSRINEVHLTVNLGVSRTPLREALSTLVGEGALTHEPRRGFFIAPLSLREASDVYPILAILVPEALRLSGLPSKARLGEARDIAERLKSAENASEAIRLDHAWHVKLIEAGSNQILLDMIEEQMRRSRRYELAYMGAHRSQLGTLQSKRRIMASLRAGELERACLDLRGTFEASLHPVLEWLRSKDGPQGRRPWPGAQPSTA